MLYVSPYQCSTCGGFWRFPSADGFGDCHCCTNPVNGPSPVKVRAPRRARKAARPCAKCSGTGFLPQYAHNGGRCYKCFGMIRV